MNIFYLNPIHKYFIKKIVYLINDKFCEQGLNNFV